jgi:hypothetical protein
MTNFVIKNELFFTLQKSEGNTDFPRKFFARKVSGNQIKIRTLGSNEALLVDVWSLENFTINGVAYTDVHSAITALQPILWNESSGNANTPVDVLPILTEIRDELLNDDSYQLFEDTDGNVLFGKIGNNGMMNYYKSDGTLYTGVVKPYSRDVIVSTTDYCANSVPYTLIQFRDADTKQVVETIWRNDNTLTESTTAPGSLTKGALQVARLHDILQTPPMAIGATVTIPANKFSTVSLLAIKGEFTVSNSANDFSSDVVLSVGTIQSYIEISEDGIGTASGATNLSQGFETRSNAYDISKSGNSYTITAVRANSILQLDLYK